jgi:hypothetical protein
VSENRSAFLRSEQEERLGGLSPQRGVVTPKAFECAVVEIPESQKAKGQPPWQGVHVSRIDRVPAIDASICIIIAIRTTFNPRKKVVTPRPHLMPALAQNLGLGRQQVRFNRMARRIRQSSEASLSTSSRSTAVSAS